MSAKIEPHSPNHRLQRGFALMALLAILATGMLYFLVNQLDEGAIQRKKNEATTQALAKAKALIIAWSVMNTAAPGRLLCPEDTSRIGTPTEGEARSNCGNGLAIGRLPWRTLGIDQLRDGDGEPLWYVLSPGFRSTPINSNTVAQLTVDGALNNAVAIVIAPGPPLVGQSRPAISSATPPVVANFLDLTNSDGDVSFVANGDPSLFNDKLLTISTQELFLAVPARVANELRGYVGTPGKGLKGYFDSHGVLPCAATASGGSAIPGNSTGFFPYADVSFDPDAHALLTNNQWLDIAIYNAPDCGATASSAIVTIGSKAIPLTFP